MHQIERPDSPLGLSSENSMNLVDEAIAQRFGINPNDPIFQTFIGGDDSKGDLIKSFFESNHSAPKRQRRR